MRYPADIISIIYLLIITAAKLMCFFYYSHKVFWVILISLLGSMLTMLIKHNHCHLGIFRHRWMNYTMDMWLNLLTGTSCSSVKIIHNMNHHVHINEKDKDWGSTHYFESRGGLLDFVSYVVTAPFLFMKSKWLWLKEHRDSFLYKYNMLENLGIIGSFVFMSYLDFQAAILVFIIPAVLLQFSLAAANYLQHFGHEPDDKKSNDIQLSWFNRLFFNIGYHSKHHDYPKRHWSLLSKSQ